ncbi:VOC family protein [Peribacillus deserti]|uniref:Glyoxalase/bleomycin resistance/dioxygenase family protein n=1 Tax=Peribacillus deserti TaxID=673318 RepID=A0A2N5M103_9BACI|nr:VOC family protein [Peribacillus deserti]PLT27995.1 glyoxalase/bleomycin resistance/dioxygenase family protein [Peribacillus deserti]
MTFHHIGIETHDPEASIAFYEKLLHFKEFHRSRFMEETFIFLSNGNECLELICVEEASAQGSLHICFHIEAFEVFLKVLEMEQIAFLEGPYTLDNGWRTVFVQGPAGEIIEFLAEN